MTVGLKQLQLHVCTAAEGIQGIWCEASTLRVEEGKFQGPEIGMKSKYSVCCHVQQKCMGVLPVVFVCTEPVYRVWGRKRMDTYLGLVCQALSRGGNDIMAVFGFE